MSTAGENTRLPGQGDIVCKVFLYAYVIKCALYHQDKIKFYQTPLPNKTTPTNFLTNTFCQVGKKQVRTGCH
jgi:hypothetical protein